MFGSNIDAQYNWIKEANWWEIVKGNIAGISFRFYYLLFISRIPKVLGMFLIGYALGRSNFYKNIINQKAKIYWIIGLGLLIGLPTNYFLAQYMSNYGDDYYNLKINGLYQTIAYALGVVPLALAYTGSLMLSFQTSIGVKLMTIVAPVGKMAFTNYISHSIICQFVFLPQGLDFGGKVGAFYLTIFAITLFGFQILLSTLWLRYFNYGPVEWVWRSLTYGKMQQFKKN
jgi:uncharacterized protein